MTRARITTLEQELHRRRWSHDDAIAEMTRTARDMGMRTFSLSGRQFTRWLAGQVANPRGAACRVAERLFGMPIEVLLAPTGQAADMQPDTYEDASASPATVADLVDAVARHTRDHAADCATGAVGSTTLEQLHVDVRRLAHAYATTPPVQLLVQLAQTRRLTDGLMRQTRRPAQLAQLYLIAGQVAGLAATTAFDLGYPDAADDLARAARTYGDLIDHAPLKAWACGVHATVAFWSGRPREGLRYVASGLDDIAGPAAARLHAIGARAWALLGAADEARAALRRAVEEHDRRHGYDELVQEVGGEFAFGAPRLALCAGAVYLALGDGRSAARHSAEALNLYQETPEPDRRWAVEHGALMDLATARVLQGDLDAACEPLGPSLGLESARRTARLTQRLQTLRSAVNRSPARSAPLARHIFEAVDDFTAGALSTANRLALPAGP